MDIAKRLLCCDWSNAIAKNILGIITQSRVTNATEMLILRQQKQENRLSTHSYIELSSTVHRYHIWFLLLLVLCGV